jgi:hypothetical protein
MARPLDITRDEAEMLVDLCEATHDGRLWILAEELRQQWGMGQQETDERGAPKRPNLKYLGL